MTTQLDWISKLDFSWFSEDENGHIATFSYGTDGFLNSVPDIVKKQYTEIAYNQLIEVILDVLPVTGTPIIIKTKHEPCDSARGLYEYMYSEARGKFELAAVPQTVISSKQLRHHNFKAFDSLVLRMMTIKYISTCQIDVVQANRLLAYR